MIKAEVPWLQRNDPTRLGADHLIREGGGLWFFLRDETFFLTPSLNVQFFQTLSKANKFFISGKTPKQFFSPFISFDSPYTVLSSQGVNTLPDLFTMFFDNEKLLYGICRTELLKLCKNLNF